MMDHVKTGFGAIHSFFWDVSEFQGRNLYRRILVKLFINHRLLDYLSFINKLCTVEPVLTHTFRWTSGAMGYHKLWVFRNSSKKTLKL